ncbi:pilus assembly protein [Altererythrobacter arenosus]|uniref:Pilus assembly protein n=1 Tax=Altererythrobacter arenosus TaxID=3032592 RepID=A0ABY8FU45_9SPHN|nr:TadE/TadG family type IV pilus assembly protein [Altererythrobacter sp. CAU 1644]WFL76641.1 pilus assembly protein [Altererythrobacter sp. CAU 1644]
MRRLVPFLARLRRDEGGATVVEFALVALPMILLLVGGLDLGYQSYARSVMQGALNDAARKASVQNPEFDSEGDTIEEQVENEIRDLVGTVALDAEIKVTQKSFFEFSDIGNPEKLMTDVNRNGQFDEEDGDCWEDANDNGEYDTDAGTEGRGGSNDVVFYSAEIAMPRLLPLDSLIDVPSTIEMTLESAVRNQPYGNQPTPPVICAVPTT